MPEINIIAGSRTYPVECEPQELDDATAAAAILNGELAGITSHSAKDIEMAPSRMFMLAVFALPAGWRRLPVIRTPDKMPWRKISPRQQQTRNCWNGWSRLPGLQKTSPTRLRSCFLLKIAVSPGRLLPFGSQLLCSRILSAASLLNDIDLSSSSTSSSPERVISVTISQPPTNSPLT